MRARRPTGGLKASGYHYHVYGFSIGAPVPEEPRNSVRPSGSVRSRPLARREPSLARYPSTTMTVPGSSASLVKPRRNSTFGVPASMAHCSTLPPAEGTSMWIQTWGLTHSILLTTAFSNLTGLLASNSAAKAWCADVGVDAISNAAPAANAAPRAVVLRIIVSPPGRYA